MWVFCMTSGYYTLSLEDNTKVSSLIFNGGFPDSRSGQ